MVIELENSWVVVVQIGPVAALLREFEEEGYSLAALFLGEHLCPKP